MGLGCSAKGSDEPAVIDDYIAFWTLDNDATDETGNYDGTQQLVTYDGVSGLFDGSNSNISINAYSETLVNSGFDFSISTWIKADTLKENVMIAFGGATNGFGFGIRSDGKIAGGFNTSHVNTQVVSQDVSALDTFYHAVITYSSATGSSEIYVDKVFKSTAICAFNDGSDLDRIGGSNGSLTITGEAGNGSFSGRISNVRIYHRILEQSHISAIYNAELAEHS